ncbi:MAG: hypothetical protein ABIW81_05295 [Terrimesophilobacter sp.]
MSFVAPGRTFRLSTRPTSSRGFVRGAVLVRATVLVRGFGALAASVALAVGGLVFAGPAVAADQPKVPQQVADYFADGLIPRLIDLYGAGDGVNKGIDFDATTSVGPISRVLEWTPDFLAGKPTKSPTRLTNTWVAPVSIREAVIGLATVWINPANDLPELAAFDPTGLAVRLAAAPPASLLVHDADRGTWFAIDGDVLTPLVLPDSAPLTATTPQAYQATITPVATVEPTSAPSGIVVASIVLGIVVIALAIFVLFPLRRGTTSKDAPTADTDLQEDSPTT